jgi:hypothetical protein
MRRLLFIIALLSLVALPASAFAEDWECKYTGHWTMDGAKDNDNFSWIVIWRAEGPDKWAVVGNNADKYGESTMDGHCDAKTCILHQEYKNGQLVGHKYTWRGTFVDKPESPTSVINAFKGEWREEPNGASHGGWEAAARCVKK